MTNTGHIYLTLVIQGFLVEKYTIEIFGYHLELKARVLV